MGTSFRDSEQFGKFLVDVNPFGEVIITAGKPSPEGWAFVKEYAKAQLCDQEGHTLYMSNKDGLVVYAEGVCIQETPDILDFARALAYAGKILEKMFTPASSG